MNKQSKDNKVDELNNTEPTKQQDGGDVTKQLTELYNNLPFEDRTGKAGLGYTLAQLDTIAHQKQININNCRKANRELSAWAKNLEQHAKEEFLS